MILSIIDLTKVNLSKDDISGKVAKSYNMFNEMFGNGTGRRMNEDVRPNINNPRFFGGSQQKQNRHDSRISKSYELMRLITGGR
jgi:hypothetical protein